MFRPTLLIASLALALAAACASDPSMDDSRPDTAGKADDTTPAAAALVTKSSGTGFVPEEWVRSETCQLFKDRVVITRQYGAVTTDQQVVIQSSDEIDELVELAAKEEITETDNFLCDGPGTFVSIGDTVLYSTGGCGSPKIERTGPASSALLDMLAAHCPKTY